MLWKLTSPKLSFLKKNLVNNQIYKNKIYILLYYKLKIIVFFMYVLNIDIILYLHIELKK